MSPNQKLAGLQRFCLTKIQTEAYRKNCQYLAWQAGQAEVKVCINRQEVSEGKTTLQKHLAGCGPWACTAAIGLQIQDSFLTLASVNSTSVIT